MGTRHEAADMLEQIDILDSAPRESVGMGGIRIGKELRRLIDAGAVKVSLEGGKVKVTTTPVGRNVLAGFRSLRGRI